MSHFYEGIYITCVYYMSALYKYLIFTDST